MLRYFPGLILFLISTLHCSTFSQKSEITTDQKQTAYMGILYTQSEHGGVVIMEVFQDSPAEKAELNVGDIILAIDGKAVAGIYTMKAQIQAMKPGTIVILDVVKDSNTMKIEKIRLELENLPKSLPPGRYYRE